MSPEPTQDPTRGRLAVEVDGAGPSVGLVHGFTQTARCWGPLARGLATDHRVISIDAPGHGRSAAVATDLWRSGELVADALGRGTLVGYSMGGRIALHAALAEPKRVERLVLISATAGIEDPAERRARIAADEHLAQQLDEIARNGAGLDDFIEDWLGLPLFAGLAVSDQDRDERRTNTAAGLASSLRLAGTGVQEPLWDRVADLDIPVLIIAGEHDPKFVATARRLARLIGDDATLAVLPGAGHTVHREAPESTLATIRVWLGNVAG